MIVTKCSKNFRGPSGRTFDPIQWLNVQSCFRIRRMRIARIAKIGGRGGRFEIHLADGRVIHVAGVKEVLDPTLFQQTVADSVGEVLPSIARSVWLRYAHCILQAAEVLEELPEAA